MREPKSQCPNEWAEWNHHVASNLSSVMGAMMPAVELERIAIRVEEFPPELTDLFLVVRRAASELQDGGERSNRIALQLLTAMARFEAAR